MSVLVTEGISEASKNQRSGF